jgi:hypothetical protein
MSRTAALTVVVAAAALALLAPAPAGAAVIGDDLVLTTGNPGVSSLHLQGVDDACYPGQPDPCTIGAGEGPANVLRVLQSEQADGTLAFSTVEGTSSIDGGWLWLAADIAAACRLGHTLHSASVEAGRSPFDGPWSEAQPSSWRVWVDTPEDQVMPTRRLVLNLPVEIALSGASTSMVEGFDTRADVLAHGEAVVAQRVADGMSEAQARALPFEVGTTVGVSADATCESSGRGGDRWTKRVQRELPLTLSYLPATASLPDGIVTPTDDDDPDRPVDVTGYSPSSGDTSGARWSTSWSAMPV